MTKFEAKRVIVLDIVGLQPEHITPKLAPNLADLLNDVIPMRPSFPSLTVPAQTTLATGQSPSRHGDVASGEYNRTQHEVEFWARDRNGRDRLWETAHDEGLTTGALFFQHLIGSNADVVITPSPIEDENNNMIEMNCWTNPDNLYDTLQEKFGHFPLFNYWGPGANKNSSKWIFDAATEAIHQFDLDMLWVYIPHLDYTGLREGPGNELNAEIEVVDELVGEFLATLKAGDRWENTVVNVVSEYGFHSVDTPVFPNQALREAGLLSVTDDDERGEEVDLVSSRAFAMVDHQIAHVYADNEAIAAAREALSKLNGIDTIIGKKEKIKYNIDHPNSGDLVIIAETDSWFQYYWWDAPDDAPEYATAMDIHAKPGFDPCELFHGEDEIVSLDPTKVGGSHGRIDPETWPVYGIGGPAAPDLELASQSSVDARAVAPTIANILEIKN
ncbi:alkaline phosphatase family protein [Haladaptatus pallidirubidus]|uniref:Alkaline phosphatase family protein n=1 Tax=Haladaptatus pallidirubidus TaxID=1008152 RepID=A0AAV3UIW8_9EURY|nr:nucleotide pyrophosphatase/phosphodiesterase family protein [Haladaptatus pallidirubidus]